MTPIMGPNFKKKTKKNMMSAKTCFVEILQLHTFSVFVVSRLKFDLSYCEEHKTAETCKCPRAEPRPLEFNTNSDSVRPPSGTRPHLAGRLLANASADCHDTEWVGGSRQDNYAFQNSIS